jgi:hypothetical protein
MWSEWPLNMGRVRESLVLSSDLCFMASGDYLSIWRTNLGTEN